jgi:pyrroline-5-carboxylate reductase
MALRLGIVGGGTMGRAIVAGCLEGGVLGPGEVVVAEIEPAPRQEIAALGCRVSADAAATLEAAQIMLAVKPQSFAGLASALGPIRGPRIVISIMAGLGSARIRAALGPGARVVRVMPNTPCRIRAGMSAIALGDGARPGDESLAVEIFGALGRTVMVNESDLHAVTAVSGSGPAYLFLLAEAMELGAMECGLSAAQAAVLVRQTLLGAGRLLAESDEAPASLRAAVTSKGGTTEAAISLMQQRGLPEIVVEAISAAAQRAQQLDKG